MATGNTSAAQHPLSSASTRWPFSLQNKLAALLIASALLPLFSLGLVGAASVRLTQRQHVADLSGQLLIQSIERVEKFILDKLETFRVKVADPNVTAIGPAQQRFILEQTIAEDSSLDEVAFLGTNGQETARRSRGGPLALRDQSASQAYQTVLAGHDYLGPVHFEGDQPLLTIASPVVNQPGQLIGVLVGQVRLDPVVELIRGATLGQAGYLYLVDGSGRIIGISGGRRTEQDVRSWPAVADALAGRTRNGLAAADRYQGLSGVAVLGAARPLPKLGWAALAEWPEDEAMALYRQMLLNILWYGLATFAGVVALGLWFSRRLVRSLQSLRQSAERIGQGDLAVEVRVASRDEFSELAQAFNQMAAGLRELDRLRDEFVFIAAHELRSPVTGMRGYLSMLLDGSLGALPDQAKEKLQLVRQANERLVDLVDKLLTVARQEAGRVAVERSPVALLPLIDLAIQELRPQAEEKRVTVERLPTPPDAPTAALADQDRLREVLVNLLGNAVKYTPASGAVQVSLRLAGNAELADHGLNAAEPHLLVRVRDTGIGISPADQAKLFTRFFRAESAQAAQIAGTGLGLFIVKQLVEQMGGRIWVESELGKGSAFSFALSAALDVSDP